MFSLWIDKQKNKIWTFPIFFAAIITSGLFFALISDFWGDLWSWLALGAPAFMMVFLIWPRKLEK